MDSGLVQPDHGDALAASRTSLELMATLMESAFETLGEGVILGTMPAYLERFGKENARYLHGRFLDCTGSGAASALSAMNFISDITQAPFEMVESTRGRAVKRLKSCEFMEAFEGRGVFPRTMICMLHRATYQGAVNGVGEHEFDVQLRSRMLFGDDHCDFEVTARERLDVSKDAANPATTFPQDAERDWLAYGFYTFILTAFIDYLLHQLRPEQVARMLDECGQKVGVKVHHLLQATGQLPEAASDQVRAVLTLGGRSFGDDLEVVACPQAEHIREATEAEPASQDAVCANACRLCTSFVQGALSQGTVSLDGSLATGADRCRFRVDP